MRIFIVSTGLYTSIGKDTESTWNALVRGVTGVRMIRRFDPHGLPTRFAAMVDDDPDVSAAQRSIRMGVSVVEEAIGRAGLPESVQAHAGLFLAAPTPDNDWRRMLAAKNSDDRSVHYLDELNSNFGAALRSAANCLSVPVLANTACASGATAIELAVEAIEDGWCEAAIVAGSDSSIYEECIAKFCLLSALSRSNDDPGKACRPFSLDRDGFVMGEGAGALVLASEKAVAKYSLNPIAEILGTGNATDGFHRTRSSPDGSAIVASMRNALESAGLPAEAIDHVNTHGTGTPENDKMESLGLNIVLGARVIDVPVTANKSMLGHTLTAAGVIEAVISAQTLLCSVIPGTLNYQKPDTSLGVNVVANDSLPMRINHVLSNSFGFGGQNVSLILGRVT